MKNAGEPPPLEFGPIEVHLPDASGGGFSFMHDLAGVFGVEFNAEAARMLGEELRRAKIRGIELDHESDYVFVEARSAAVMRAALEAVARCASREAFAGCDLEAIERAMRAWKRPRGASFRVGDVVGVPLYGGKLGAAQIIDGASPGLSVVFLLLDVLANDLPSLSQALGSSTVAPLAARASTSADVASGRFPVVTRLELPGTIDLGKLIERESRRSGGIVELFESCLGLAPWEGRYPHEHDVYLVDGREPPRRRYRRAIFEHRLRELYPASPVTPQRGPGTLHVLVAYRGGAAVPPLHELPKLDRLRAALAKASSAGYDDEICCGGGGDGFFDVFAQVDDVAAACTLIDEIAAELRVTKDLLVDVHPRFNFDWRGTLQRMS